MRDHQRAKSRGRAPGVYRRADGSLRDRDALREGHLDQLFPAAAVESEVAVLASLLATARRFVLSGESESHLASLSSLTLKRLKTLEAAVLEQAGGEDPRLIALATSFIRHAHA